MASEREDTYIASDSVQPVSTTAADAMAEALLSSQLPDASITPHNVMPNGLVHPLLDNPNYMFVGLRTSMGGRFLLRARDTDTVERLKVKIAARLNIPVKQQCLMLNGVELQDHKLITESGVTERASLMLTVRLSSGPLLQSAPELPNVQDSQAVVHSVAAHLSKAAVQDAIVRGEEVSFVTQLHGRYMMVRMNNKGAQPCTCGKHDGSQAAQPSEPQSGPTAERDAAINSLKIQHDNARLRERISDIRARLQERDSNKLRRKDTLSTSLSSTPLGQSSEAANQSPQPTDTSNKAKSAKRNSRRCQACPAKLGLVQFPCKCGSVFCSSHRQPSTHACSFNYQSA